MRESVFAIICLLVIVAIRAYRRPQHEPKNQSQPKWLERVDRSHPLLEVIVGVFMLSYALTLTAAAEALKAHPGEINAALAGLVFAVTSIVTIAAPLVLVLVAPERSRAVLATWKNWILGHSRSIMLIALMVIGVAVAARGIHDLVA